ncbi:MAG: hypothetical protein P1P65_02990 [Treponema sp.]
MNNCLTRKILIVVLCAAVNVLSSVLSRFFNLPLYLDSVLTIAAAALCGIGEGITTAILSAGMLFIIGRNIIPFTLCHITTAVFAYLVFSQAKKRVFILKIDSFIWAGLLSAVSNAVLVNIISDFVYASNTAENINNSVQTIYLAVPNLTFATYFSGFLTNFADKLISAYCSYLFYKVMGRTSTER